VLAATGGVPSGGGAPARAEVIYTMLPSLSVGWTDNAASSPTNPQSDEFLTAGVGATARYTRATSSYGLTYLLAYTRFFQGHGPDTLTNSLALSSAFALSGTLDLGFTAGAGLTRANSFVSDLTTVMPMAVAGQSTEVLTASVGQSLSYRPTARRTYTETLAAAQLHYIDAPMPLPTTTTLSGEIRGAQATGLDNYYLDLAVFDTFTPTDPALQQDAFARGHTLFARLFAGWGRELSPSWSAHVEGGPIAVFKVTGPAIVAPGGALAADYRRRPWFGTASISQQPAANLYIGQATINDQVMARLALPVNRNETVFVAAFGSYIFARVATAQGDLGRAFDQRNGGVEIAARPLQLPLAVSLQYTIVDQHGGHPAGSIAVPDLLRQSVMLTVGGVLAWGPGTPPLFGGGP
jgi:hypothetical protein